MGAARRQVAEGGAGAGESVVEVQARYNCSCRASKHCSLQECSRSGSVRGECVAARNECSAGQPVPAACGGGGVVKTRGMPLGRSLETSSE